MYGDGVAGGGVQGGGAAVHVSLQLMVALDSLLLKHVVLRHRGLQKNFLEDSRKIFKSCNKYKKPMITEVRRVVDMC